MTGFVLHPYKTVFADKLRQFFTNLEASDRPVVWSVLVDSCSFVDWSCVTIGNKIFKEWKAVLLMSISLPAYIYMAYLPINPILDLVTINIDWLYKIDHFLEYLTLMRIASLIACYCISVTFLWTPERNHLHQVCSVIVWSLSGLYFLTILWPPLWMSLVCIFLYNSAFSSNKEGEKSSDEVDAILSRSKRERFRMAVLTVLHRLNNTEMIEEEDLNSPDGGPPPSSSSTPLAYNKVERIENPAVSALKKRISVKSPSDTPLSAQSKTFHQRQYRSQILKRSSSIELSSSEESNVYIKWVLWFCMILQLYIHPSLLHLLPFPILYTVLRKLFCKLDLSDFSTSVKAKCSEFYEARESALLPKPVKVIGKEIYKVEKSVLRVLPKFTDPIVTSLLILTMILGFVFIVVFVGFQMYTESMYIMQTSGRLVGKVTNSSLYQNLNASLGDHEQYFTGFEDVIESGYHYGREYISSSVVSMLRDESKDNNKESVDEFEKKLLELWDRIYQYWLSRNAKDDNNNNNNSMIDSGTGSDSEATGKPPAYGPQVSEEAIVSSAEEVIQRVISTLDLTAFSQFTMNNMGTLISVLDQGWTLLKGNLGFALTVVTEVLRILFHSGSGMINFVLSTIVYFTALFYLLSANSQVYKPIEIITNHSGMFVGTGFANALNKAVTSVFKVTFKMALFYGLWTYLTHALFRASIVTVPVLSATFLAAVPVAGQVLVALPAALELWLTEERWISALALIVCHIVPTYVVDAAIYSEVKQGIHPWITGLSIVGGVYCFGMFGAIYGPLFLCGVYVILTVYTGWLQEIPMEPTAANLGKSKMQPQATSQLATPVIKRADSVY